MRFTPFFSRIVKPIISFFKKSTFLPSKGLLYLRDKQNNRWSLADMGLLFSCLSRYEEIITVYILSLDIEDKIAEFVIQPQYKIP